MKLSHFVILFSLIILTPLLLTEYRSTYSKETMKLNEKYELAMTVAAHDAINVLRTNVKTQLQNGYDSYKINPVNPEPAFETFIETLSLNFKSENDVTIDLLSRYIPVFAIVDYDGLLLNVYKEYVDDSGEKVIDRVWLPFTLPLIPQEDWYNTVDDISILAFFQGYPSIIDDVFYQKYAFVGTRLNYQDRILAGTVEGIKKFWYESCELPYSAEEIYSTKRDAAANGYSELACINSNQ